MVTFGVVCYPVFVSGQMMPPAVDKDMNVAKQSRYEAIYDFVFVNIDNPTDQLAIRIESHAMDNADKACGKAISYGKKYAILKLFEIETGEDEESRYIDVNDYIRDISDCESMEELEAVFRPIYINLQSNPKDLKKVIKAKDALKGSLIANKTVTNHDKN
jgi:hypothetical protein